MGHRAVLLYRFENKFMVFYSHWGAYQAELLEQISESTPFGSENMEPEFVNALTSALAGMADSNGMELEGELTKAQDTTPVETEPIAVIEENDWYDGFLEFGHNHIDPIFHEVVYTVDTVASPWNVEAYGPVYWRNDPAYQEAREDDPMGATPVFALVKAGKDAHDVWGGREAESYEDFKSDLLAEFNNEDVTLF